MIKLSIQKLTCIIYYEISRKYEVLTTFQIYVLISYV